MILRVCSADELRGLLPAAIAGRTALMPLADPGDAAALRPDLPAGERTAVVVTTSGSTGTPKQVMLSADAMLASARATRERLGGPMHWYSPLPLHYVAGLMTLVRSHEAGTTTVDVRSDLADLPPAELDQPRAISIVPTQLHRVMAADADPWVLERLAGFDAVLLGGAPAPTDLLDRARAAGVRLVTTYGMSETCGGCVYDGVPLPGADVRLDEATGRIMIGGPMLFSGYRFDPSLTEETLVDGRFLTSDRGEWGPDGRLRVLGRVDDVVISGGVNVDLAQVQRHVDMLGVVGAVVGVPDDEWGTVVTLAVEGHDEGDLKASAWRERLAASGLGRPALPRRVVGMIRLPRTDSGKIDRRALSRLLRG